MTGRPLTCTVCGDTVTVYELPKPFIDPVRYRCGDCQAGTRRAQLELLARRQETRDYDPAMAEVPF